MTKKELILNVEEYGSAAELNEADAALLQRAKDTTVDAYAPYSGFRVAAAALLLNGEIVTGTNQENASFPAGICAKRVMLASAATLFPGIAIDTLAISYHNHNANGHSDHPVSPCGICRQTLAEYQERVKHPIRLLLSGMEGKVIAIEKASDLLPLSFGGTDLK